MSLRSNSEIVRLPPLLNVSNKRAVLFNVPYFTNFAREWVDTQLSATKGDETHLSRYGCEDDLTAFQLSTLRFSREFESPY